VTEPLRPRTAALTGIVLGGLAWWVLVFAGYGVERSACPAGAPLLATIVGVACPLVASAGWVLAVWAYAASASQPSNEWLVGAAGLYLTTLAAAATITGGIALLVVDLCSL